jgi:uncharacterized SAM-binding protein YcdF (DUF218 family)
VFACRQTLSPAAALHGDRERGQSECRNAEDPGPTCAQVMADFLIQLGVPASDIVQENFSRSTYENAVECAKLVEPHNIRKAVLVVDAVDMYRALRCCRNQGMELASSPCHYRATKFDASFFAFVPNAAAAGRCQRAWHEWLGTGWYWLKGRIRALRRLRPGFFSQKGVCPLFETTWKKKQIFFLDFR